MSDLVRDEVVQNLRFRRMVEIETCDRYGEARRIVPSFLFNVNRGTKFDELMPGTNHQRGGSSMQCSAVECRTGQRWRTEQNELSAQWTICKFAIRCRPFSNRHLHLLQPHCYPVTLSASSPSPLISTKLSPRFLPRTTPSLTSQQATSTSLLSLQLSIRISHDEDFPR